MLYALPLLASAVRDLEVSEELISFEGLITADCFGVRLFDSFFCSFLSYVNFFC